MNTILYLEHPVVSYFLMGVSSIIATVIFFLIGGSYAEFSGQENTFAGITFKAGGAIAGFVIILFTSLNVNDTPG